MNLVTLPLHDPELLFVPVEKALDGVMSSDAWTMHLEKLKELLAHLRTDATPATYYANISARTPYELSVHGSQRGNSVVIWADFWDKNVAESESEILHFRMQIHRDGSRLSKDVRTADPAAVARQLRIALGPGLKLR